MKIPRMTALTLGVRDLQASLRFYREVFSVEPDTQHEGVVFIEMPGVWLMLYPLENLAADISTVQAGDRGRFSGITLGYNARSREEVLAVFGQAKAAGAIIDKAPHDTFWGGFSGYFSDPDGYHWEIAWGPMFDFTANGDLKHKP